MMWRAIAQDAMPAGQSTAGIALQDISNRQRTAAEAPETQAGYLKGKGPALQNLSSASEEAQSCLRSSVCASWTGRPEHQKPLMCRMRVPCTEIRTISIARLCTCSIVPAVTHRRQALHSLDEVCHCTRSQVCDVRAACLLFC